MIEWRADGLLLSVRPHGEASAIINVLTRERGRHAGVVRGGQSRKRAPLLQPGAQLDVTWKARIEDHLGSFTFEPLRSRAAMLLEDRAALATLSAVCALAGACLPERAPMPDVYDRTVALCDALCTGQDWPARYALWEFALLGDLGFGLSLDQCAVTGARQGLPYVSPRTGRAVSAEGAGEWADRLLPLPGFLRGDDHASAQDVKDALRLTGHFLRQRVVPTLRSSGPIDARDGAERAIVRLLSN
ncbi:DNA repair protein RecO [Pontivivens insulae]|uniref:DNA repair protein RecO n=1 Tax=Pontivivens insulae TaxID=1639689 RepID=A0A2R8ADB8_9RHOB|nr:DNA replication and repair protein RecO [Pontivivens insulae]SPF30243.1 DNA repair protein RecO [Pontivivens insulae]